MSVFKALESSIQCWLEQGLVYSQFQHMLNITYQNYGMIRHRCNRCHFRRLYSYTGSDVRNRRHARLGHVLWEFPSQNLCNRGRRNVISNPKADLRLGRLRQAVDLWLLFESYNKVLTDRRRTRLSRNMRKGTWLRKEDISSWDYPNPY